MMPTMTHVRRAKAHRAANEDRTSAPSSWYRTESLDFRGIRHTWSMIYGTGRMGRSFHASAITSSRLLTTFIQEAGERLANQARTARLAAAVADTASHSAWSNWLIIRVAIDLDAYGGTASQTHSARQALPIDMGLRRERTRSRMFTATGRELSNGSEVCRSTRCRRTSTRPVAASRPLPSTHCQTTQPMHCITDPPYYDAVPYADLSDFFYVWLNEASDDFTRTYSRSQRPKRRGNRR